MRRCASNATRANSKRKISKRSRRPTDPPYRPSQREDLKTARVQREYEMAMQSLEIERSQNRNLYEQLHTTQDLLVQLQTNENLRPDIQQTVRDAQFERENIGMEMKAVLEKNQKLEDLLQYHEKRHESDLLQISELRGNLQFAENNANESSSWKARAQETQARNVQLQNQLSTTEADLASVSDELRQMIQANLDAVNQWTAKTTDAWKLNDDLTMELGKTQVELSSAEKRFEQMEAEYKLRISSYEQNTRQLEDENLQLRSEWQKVQNEKRDVDIKAIQQMREIEDLTERSYRAEREAQDIKQDNDSLMRNINDVESKNRSLVTTLDKNIAERAREYKERTVERLTSPRNKQRYGAQTYSTSPRNQQRQGAQTYRDPVEDGSVSARPQTYRGQPNNTSALKQLKTKVFNMPESNMPKSRSPSPDSCNETPGKFQFSSELDSQLGSPIAVVTQPPSENLTQVRLSPYHPASQPRLNLDPVYSNPADDNPPTFRGEKMPANMIKDSLSEIKIKLQSLQENKAALESKMGEFEKRIAHKNY